MNAAHAAPNARFDAWLASRERRKVGDPLVDVGGAWPSRRTPSAVRRSPEGRRQRRCRSRPGVTADDASPWTGVPRIEVRRQVLDEIAGHRSHGR